MGRDRVIARRPGRWIGTASLIALLVLAALIALDIWQPWNGIVTLHSTPIPTYDATSGTR